MKLLVLLTLCALLSDASAKPRPRNWLVGSLQESAEAREDLGTLGHAMTFPNYGWYGSQASVRSRNLHQNWVGFVIEGNGYRYMVAYPVARKRANVTVHGQIKYAFEKADFYVLDEDGREFKCVVLEKSLILPRQAGEPGKQ